MSCNHTAQASDAVAPCPGAEAAWAINRQHPQYCPVCRAFLRADGGCTRCESAAKGTPAPAETLAMAAPGIVSRAAATGERVAMADHWRNEFRQGDAIVLRNGETLESGKRYSGKEHPEYCVSQGKVRQQVTVGNFITPAVDQLSRYSEKDRIITAELTDGGVGYYDLGQRAACCGGDCAASHSGMCHHQLAAIAAGEMAFRPADSADHAALMKQARDQFSGGVPGTAPSTAETMRRGDAVYALLKHHLPEVRVNAQAVGDAAKAVPVKAAPKPRKAAPVTTPAPAPGKAATTPVRGNPQVSAIMQAIGVTPPVATVAEIQAADPTLAGYRGYPVPNSDPRYEVGQQEEKRLRQIMQRVGMGWRAAKRRVESAGGDVTDPGAYPATMEDRCWGLYGPPGTGKNAMAKEVAASLGLGYMEVDVRDRSDFQTLLCDTVIEADGKGGTRSVAKLGPVGHALTSGNVVALNEIVAADPDAQTALHQVLQDGVIRAPGPEGATQSWRVHPNSMVFLTWNPGTTRADKPGAALLSRTPSLAMDYPPPQDEAKRLARTMSDYLGESIAPGDVKRSVNLVRGLRELHLRGELETCPTYRDMVSFTKSYYLNGQNRHGAAEVFEVLCSQSPGQREDEWKQVHNLVDSFQEGTWKL